MAVKWRSKMAQKLKRQQRKIAAIGSVGIESGTRSRQIPRIPRRNSLVRTYLTDRHKHAIFRSRVQRPQRDHSISSVGQRKRPKLPKSLKRQC